ncbi:uncharacterized protein LACBIDRAFT_327924 [Laccaria bicolor S238N-H82]|uniref:Predicted protein n=1 Tax=Laccaria bicolor (strain S238N-H82 / ATCC MYA-4686) TaxID=486041 RepID=B0DD86_LACBS|nr:uncharacterized protein LACBIDRAFT_327924 [Laccaria bicolor S238N-H82]EDR07564.1 predicted protein [Laccaria bicolor S238N-H82]|eukprot:XP_001881956.1 predicted protein [Laccaria bicolor S238N-H82]
MPKATAPKNAMPKLVAPKAAAPTPAPKPAAPKQAAPKQAALKQEAPVAVKVAGPSKPQNIAIKTPCYNWGLQTQNFRSKTGKISFSGAPGSLGNFNGNMLAAKLTKKAKNQTSKHYSEMSLLDSTPKAKPKAQPSIALPSDSAPTEIGKSLQMKSSHPTDQFNCPARMEDRIITLKKQCKRLAAQVEETREKLDSVIKEQKEDVAELLLKLKKMEQSVTSTKDWTMQKVIFAMESLFLLGNGIHPALLELVMKMTDLLEEMGALVLVESNDSVAKVKELSVLYSAPPIPAGIQSFQWNSGGIHRNLQESAGITQEYSGIPLESSELM